MARKWTGSFENVADVTCEACGRALVRAWVSRSGTRSHVFCDTTCRDEYIADYWLQAGLFDDIGNVPGVFGVPSARYMLRRTRRSP